MVFSFFLLLDLLITKKTVETRPIHDKTAKNTGHSKKANHQIFGRDDIKGSNENSPSCKLFSGRNKNTANITTTTNLKKTVKNEK